MTERQLIDRALSGDRAAERELYDRHVDRVFRLAFRLTDGDRELARDFAQDVFLRAFDRLPGFRGDAALATWLHAITVSVVLNGMRRVRRRRSRETDLMAARAQAPEPPAIEPDLKRRLRAAIARLPEKYRVVFVMFDVEGYSHDEIGAALGMPTGTSKARLSRARARLREDLADYAGERVS